MSFGFGVGDFVAVVELARKIRKDFAGAPEQLQQITSELRNLTIVLQDVEISILSNDISDAKKNDLREITNNSSHVLQDLKKVIDKSNASEKDGSVRKRAGRVWERLKWDPDEIRDLRARITSNIATLHTLSTGYIRDNINQLLAAKDERKRQEILDWLTPTNSFAQQTDFIGRRQPGTGQWLLESLKYNKWKAAKGEILFCYGIPGAGKTILSSTVVDDLRARCGPANVAICYFYCNFQRQEEQQLDNIIFIFIKQLVQATTTIPECLEALYRKHKQGQSRPSLEEATGILHSITRSFSQVFCVVDALDECQKPAESNRGLIEHLIEFSTLTDANVLATSRPIPRIREKFNDFASLEILASPLDIRKYIEGHIHDLPGFVGRNPVLIDEITNTIAKATSGMFLLAKLHLDSLRGKRSEKALKKTLKNLAKGNDAYTEAYRTTISRIHGQHQDQKELALQALTWIAYAKRALSTLELKHALGVEVDAVEFSDSNISDLEDTISACCGLVTIDEASDIVRLVHYTTQEFFEDQGRSYLPDADAEIANTCVAYLSFDAFRDGPCKKWSVFEQRLHQFPLYDYSSRFWGFHAQYLKDFKAVQDFLGSSYHMEGSSQALVVDREYWSQQAPSRMTALHLAAYFGLIQCLTMSSLSGFDIDSLDHYHRTPLLWSAKNGHKEFVRLLLEKNAQIDIPETRYGRRALSWAAENGHEEVVRLLLDRSAEVDARDDYDGTALIWAARSGHEVVVRLLLEKNAEIDIAGGEYDRTPLTWAAEKGHEKVVQLLLEKNAQVDIPDNECGRTALSWAARRGYLQIVQLLLRNNAQVDARDKSGETALIWAARSGHEMVVRLLLDKNAQVDACDTKEHKTPLSWAAHFGHEKIVHLLLGKNAQINDRDIYGATPLLWAAKHGRIEVVRLLLDRNAQVDLGEYSGQTPLLWAAQKGFTRVVRLLLDKTAQIDACDAKEHKTPLSWAAHFGHEKIVHLLLGKNAQINDRDIYGATPLLWAAKHGRTEVVRLLLDRNAQVDLGEYSGQTPLSWAKEFNYDEVEQLLLGHMERVIVK